MLSAMQYYGNIMENKMETTKENQGSFYNDSNSHDESIDNKPGPKCLKKFDVTSKMKYKYIAVDFDKTLCTDNYPETGKQRLIHKIVLNFVLRHQKKGSTVILNTLRKEFPLLNAVEWCHAHDLFPTYINENPTELIRKFGDSRKIACTLNIDDTNIGLIGWLLRRTK